MRQKCTHLNFSNDAITQYSHSDRDYNAKGGDTYGKTENINTLKVYFLANSVLLHCHLWQFHQLHATSVMQYLNLNFTAFLQTPLIPTFVQ
jgi:hypothetical protein